MLKSGRKTPHPTPTFIHLFLLRSTTSASTFTGSGHSRWFTVVLSINSSAGRHTATLECSTSLQFTRHAPMHDCSFDLLWGTMSICSAMSNTLPRLIAQSSPKVAWIDTISQMDSFWNKQPLALLRDSNLLWHDLPSL